MFEDIICFVKRYKWLNLLLRANVECLTFRWNMVQKNINNTNVVKNLVLYILQQAYLDNFSSMYHNIEHQSQNTMANIFVNYFAFCVCDDDDNDDVHRNVNHLMHSAYYLMHFSTIKILALFDERKKKPFEWTTRYETWDLRWNGDHMQSKANELTCPTNFLASRWKW